MIHAIAIDDEPFPLEILSGYCQSIEFLKLEQTFTQTTTARNYLIEHAVDLVFLDIQMPTISGIDFYKGLPKQPMVIFTTAHSEYAVEGFEVNAVDYLLKPYSPERFRMAVIKAKEFLEFTRQKSKAGQDYIFVKADYSVHKILLSDVLFIEGLADYLKIYLQGGKMLITRMTMKGILSRLPENEFIRVHRSFIVRFMAIRSVRNKTIQLDGKSIPLGESFEKEFFRIFKG